MFYGDLEPKASREVGGGALPASETGQVHQISKEASDTDTLPLFSSPRA
jgi:hypothetical protein